LASTRKLHKAPLCKTAPNYAQPPADAWLGGDDAHHAAGTRIEANHRAVA